MKSLRSRLLLYHQRGFMVSIVYNNLTIPLHEVDMTVREGANKQVISSQADSLIKISRIWADFFPANNR
ncbi:hypothetical protein, partial [Escherichia coli]|uniref:hypothetical protein n=1 Tax=Escherichia coli TaxID=562 RepID=UPI001BC92D1B